MLCVFYYIVYFVVIKLGKAFVIHTIKMNRNGDIIFSQTHYFGWQIDFMLIQNSLTNGRFSWINSSSIGIPTSFPGLNCSDKYYQVMLNTVDTNNVVMNSNDEEVTIPPGYYTIAEIIAILSILTDTTFSITTKASSYGCTGFYPLVPFISPMLRLFEKSSV